MTWRAPLPATSSRLDTHVNPPFLSWMSSYDVASNTWQTLSGGGSSGSGATYATTGRACQILP